MIADTNPYLACVIPDTGYKSLRYYYEQFYTSQNLPVPPFKDGKDLQRTHEGSEVEMLYLPITMETWKEFTHWVREREAPYIASSRMVRLYTERGTKYQYDGICYLTVFAPPYRKKADLVEYAAHYLKTDITPLFASDEDEEQMAPPAEKPKFVPKPLPPRPTRNR